MCSVNMVFMKEPYGMDSCILIFARDLLHLQQEYDVLVDIGCQDVLYHLLYIDYPPVSSGETMLAAYYGMVFK